MATILHDSTNCSYNPKLSYTQLQESLSDLKQAVEEKQDTAQVLEQISDIEHKAKECFVHCQCSKKEENKNSLIKDLSHRTVNITKNKIIEKILEGFWRNWKTICQIGPMIIAGLGLIFSSIAFPFIVAIGMIGGSYYLDKRYPDGIPLFGNYRLSFSVKGHHSSGLVVPHSHQGC